MNPAAHRVSLTVLVGLTALATVTGIVAATPMLERTLPSMPAVPTTRIAAVLVATGGVAFIVWAIAQLSRAARTRSRRAALEAIAYLIAAGLRNREMAERLFVSENTVKTHASRVFDKLGAGRRTQAVKIAKQQRIIA